jgi:glycosyltransferase involved in cell wall biosynthesis/predicted O-methyltransferase YrrM
MKRVAIVVQRCHESIAGGSESLAWNYATLLRRNYEVEVLTTTALETRHWANVLPAGREQKDGITLIRFPVTHGRSDDWGQLHQRLSRGFDPYAPGRHRNTEKALLLNWPLSLQEEFIRKQGPDSAALNAFIGKNWRDYQALIFVTYLYPTTYFGLHQLPAGEALFAPTLHDELPAYLPAYKHAAGRARELLWLTKAEQRVGQKLWGDLPGRVVGMTVDTKPRDAEPSSLPYLLYCGRVDPNKGCAQLFEYYFKYKRATRSKLRLVITGAADMEIPPHPDIEFRGFVGEEEKFRLMAGAKVYLVPSANESFSIVTLEALAQRTPVLASSGSEVLVDHVNGSGAGGLYHDYESFASQLSSLLKQNGSRRNVGESGREYVLENYNADHISEVLADAIEAKSPNRRPVTREQFATTFAHNLDACAWREHPLYSPFTQYDHEFYLAHRPAFVHKYRCFYAVSKTISPQSIIELGTAGGSSADAYLSASPTATYVGIDVFGCGERHDDGTIWDPYETAKALFIDRGFQNWQLIRANLRAIQELRLKAELVVVDAAHDFENEYADLQLALTADPRFIFVDDADDPEAAKPAIEKFLNEDLKGRVEYTFPIQYVGGGLVIKLRS